MTATVTRRPSARTGTRKSGWCLDEQQARDHDQHDQATRFHGGCRTPDTCACPHHDQEETR